MKWPLLPRRNRESEAKYIDGLRRKITSVDRWRPMKILLCLCTIVIVIFLYATVMSVFWVLPDDEPVKLTLTRVWIAVAMSGGIIMAQGLTMVIQSLTLSFPGVRTTRLLLKYYDAHHSEQNEDTETVKFIKQFTKIDGNKSPTQHLSQETILIKWPQFLRRNSKTEEEYIDGLHRNIASVDRWKPLWILLGLCVIVVLIYLFATLLRLFWVLPYDEPAKLTIARIWIAVSMSGGFMMSLGFIKAMQYLILSSSGIRNERLLLKYYDAQKSV